MKQFIFSTGNHWTGLVARVSLGLLMLPHGLQKALGWIGGYGFSATMEYFTKSVGLPWLMAALVIITEFIGALCLILGLATRFWSVAMILLMAGTIVTVHWSHGFFMNWDGTGKGEGFEYQLAMIALALVALVNGGGRYSVDRKLA